MAADDVVGDAAYVVSWQGSVMYGGSSFRCPKCRQLLQESANVPMYKCGGCYTVLQAGRLPDQHGEENLSPTCETLSTKGQTEMENEIVEGPNEAGVSSECEFQLKNPSPTCEMLSTKGQAEMENEIVEGPNGRNTENTLIVEIVKSLLFKVLALFSPYPNSDGPVVPHPHITSTQILGENMGSLGDWRNLFASLEEPLLQVHVSGSMWTVPPCLDEAPSRLMPTIAHTTGSSDDLRNLLPWVEEPFSAGHVSGSIDWTVPPCSIPAQSQPMPTIAHTTGSSDELRNLLAMVEEPFSAGHVSGMKKQGFPLNILGENMGSLGDWRNLFASLEEPLLQMHVSGSMWTVPPCLDRAPNRLMSTIAHTTGSSDDLRNLLPLVEEPFSAGHVFGSIDWTIPPCSVPAPSQPMPTIAHTTGSSDDLRNLLPMVEEPFSVGHVSGSIDWSVPPCSVPALSQPMPTIAHTTGSSDDLRNLPMVEEPFSAGHVSGSIDGTVPLCSVPALSQLMPTIPHTMPTIPRIMPLLTERQDTRSVKLRATYGDTTIKFNLPPTSGISELNKEVLKRLEFELGKFRVEYEDEDGVLILIACDEDVRDYLQFLTSSGNQVFKPLVLKKVPNTTNVCETCESLKRKRQ
ncbi:hypothetical protein RHGRI_038712 [Rhododendron griersonianum]|uniref:PB1 domain-containing protein n=1 Tax=Rhododendron griersonianum TaxID=479676 RepID=A0AAV6HIJ7_9ERIC|nr:hypothetical protein RHGRI_038712 [Rhododendron griersonianum]